MTTRTGLCRTACRIAVSLLASALFMPGTGRAATGNDIYRDLASVMESSQKAFAWGYVMGAAAAEHNSGKVCLPPGMTVQNLTGDVADWLRDHPDQRTLEASLAVTGALKAIHPCGGAGRPARSTPPAKAAAPAGTGSR